MVKSEVAQSCLTLCNPVDCSLPGSSVHGILQARILEWVDISFSRGSSRPRVRTQASCITGRFFTVWATREALKDRFRCFRPLWTIKKVEHGKMNAFELWCWRRLLRVPWTERISNQSILKEISPEYSLEGLMLKLKLQYLAIWCKELTHWKRPWCWERLKAGGEGGDRGWDGEMASPAWWTWVWASSRSWWWTGKPGVLQSMGVTKSQMWLSNWTELNALFNLVSILLYVSEIEC